MGAGPLDGTPDTRASNDGVGPLLRAWRDIRGKSQMALSLDTGISQRHLSYVESGRSAPSRDMLLTVARTLSIPLRERNRLLLAGGYAPAYREDPLGAEAMDRVDRVLDRMLRQHDPFPAVVLDRYWNVLRTNDAAPLFFGSFVDLSRRPTPRNLLHLMFDPAGMRPFVANWEAASQSLLERVRQESVGGVLDERSHELVSQLLAYPGTNTGSGSAAGVTDTIQPVIPISFRKGDHVLNYFSMVTTVGTPTFVAAQELRLECMFPADDDTEVLHRALMDSLADPST